IQQDLHDLTLYVQINPAETPAVVKEEEEDSDDEDRIAVPEGKIDPSKFDNFKLTLVVRTDLGMTKGKIAAQ
ncbi:hypothetical protein CU097_000643, partial [Rhizopus azygosporus]